MDILNVNKPLLITQDEKAVELKPEVTEDYDSFFNNEPVTIDYEADSEKPYDLFEQEYTDDTENDISDDEFTLGSIKGGIAEEIVNVADYEPLEDRVENLIHGEQAPSEQSQEAPVEQTPSAPPQEEQLDTPEMTLTEKEDEAKEKRKQLRDEAKMKTLELNQIKIDRKLRDSKVSNEADAVGPNEADEAGSNEPEMTLTDKENAAKEKRNELRNEAKRKTLELNSLKEAKKLRDFNVKKITDMVIDEETPLLKK
jgi:hypothetical protein